MAFTTIWNLPGENGNYETHFPLSDEMEQCFASPEIAASVMAVQFSGSGVCPRRLIADIAMVSPTARQMIEWRLFFTVGDDAHHFASWVGKRHAAQSLASLMQKSS